MLSEPNPEFVNDSFLLSYVSYSFLFGRRRRDPVDVNPQKKSSAEYDSRTATMICWFSGHIIFQACNEHLASFT